MSDIGTKLNYLLETKTQIGNAIVSKGVELPDDATFREYADLIRDIPTGTGEDVLLQLGEIEPTGKSFIQYPDDGYDGFSRVIVAGDKNLAPQNIAEGVTIYGVTGTLEIAPTASLPEVYESYVEHAKTMYTGDYDHMAILESSNHVSVMFMTSDFAIQTYDTASSEFTAIGWVSCTYVKSEDTWKLTDWSETCSEGQNYVNNIRYSSTYWVYNGLILYPTNAYVDCVGDGTKAVAYVSVKLPAPYPAGITPYTLTLTCGSNVLTGSYTKAGQTITYALPTTGTWKGQFTDYEDAIIAEVSFDVTPFMYTKTADLSDKHILAEDSWETISALAQSGSPEMYYTLGDEKDVELTTGETVTLQIIGFTHDVLADGTGYAGITFCMKNSMASTNNMNSSSTNVGGWASCAMRTRLQPGGAIYDTLPDDVKAVIRPVQKVTSVGNAGTALETTNDYCFLLSEVEIFGSTSYSVAGEGKQYDYYSSYATTSAKRVKYLSNGSGSAYTWWGRSPYSSDSTIFCYVYSGGDASYSYANLSRGVSFGFCV